MEAFLLHIGINPADVFAGFTGGMIAGLVTTGGRPTIWNVFVSVVVGAGLAGYGGPVLPAYIGAKPSGFASLVIGIGGMPISRLIIAGISRVRWSPFERKNGE